MKNRSTLKIGIICAGIFILLTSYFWYLYFHEYEGEVLANNVRVELVNSGHVDYINAIVNDDERNIPTYYFRVQNFVETPVYYDVLINDVKPSEAKDGCSDGTLFTREELDYELKLDNKVIRTGTLSELKDNILDSNELETIGVKDYSIRIYLNENAKNSLDKHYHYTISLREKK